MKKKKENDIPERPDAFGTSGTPSPSTSSDICDYSKEGKEKQKIT